MTRSSRQVLAGSLAILAIGLLLGRVREGLSGREDRRGQCRDGGHFRPVLKRGSSREAAGYDRAVAEPVLDPLLPNLVGTERLCPATGALFKLPALILEGLLALRSAAGGEDELGRVPRPFVSGRDARRKPGAKVAREEPPNVGAPLPALPESRASSPPATARAETRDVSKRACDGDRILLGDQA